jgi:hypothetical protein
VNLRNFQVIDGVFLFVFLWINYVIARYKSAYIRDFYYVIFILLISGDKYFFDSIPNITRMLRDLIRMGYSVVKSMI